MQESRREDALVSVHGPAEDQGGNKHGQGPQWGVVNEVQPGEEDGCGHVGPAHSGKDIGAAHEAMELALHQEPKDHLLDDPGQGKK